MTSALLLTHEDTAPALTRRRRGTGQPLILIVDDDPGMRRFVRAVVTYSMASAGSAVDAIEAADSFEAVCSAREAGRPVDLLISDIRLGACPSGVELAHYLAHANPRMRILLMSGTDGEQGLLPKEWYFLAKPFRMADLVELIRALCG